MIDPITREEFLLAKALGENVPDIVPVIRKEMYLAKIAGADIQTPEAITREEMYLDAIANGTEVNIEPITRKEMFYAKALGLIENAPEPITRIEGLLNQITVGGGGGSYDKYSWEGVFASIKACTYATDYAIGDMIPLDLGSEGLINMQIVAFDTDDLADGSGKAPITWIAKELLKTTHRMNPNREGTSGAYTEGTGAIGGWEKSEMRTYLTETIKPLIPEEVRNAIVPVTKYSMIFNTDGSSVNNVATTDDVWIPSYREIFGETTYETYGVTYSEKFPDTDSRIKQSVGGSAKDWWLRTPQKASYDTSRYFLSVNVSGGVKAWVSSANIYVPLGFCT